MLRHGHVRCAFAKLARGAHRVAEAGELRVADSFLGARTEPLEAAATMELRAAAEATAFLQDRSLAQWVRQQNAEKGLAPSSSSVWGLRQKPSGGDQRRPLRR